MSRNIPQLWTKKGGIQVSDVGFGFYVVNFETIADYERAMFGGPWMINDHYVVIQEWRPYFRPEETFLSTLRVWVRLPGIPFEYFDRTILNLIGDRIGRTVRIDHTTLEGSRGNFARICVEVDLSKPLLYKYRLRRRVHRIEYEGCTQFASIVVATATKMTHVSLSQNRWPLKIRLPPSPIRSFKRR
ncbi:hypothetical protein LINPERPRIM_LOCUS5150 [Linum perenne]